VRVPPRRLRGHPHRSLLAALALAVSLPAAAADLVVRVSGVGSASGQVGCALFAGTEGFPMNTAAARVAMHPADPKGVVCRFPGVAPGTYAVAAFHDLNGNGRTDTSFVGMPTEPWGVSRNIRHTMRAPSFDEAAFPVPAASGEQVVEIQVVR